MAEVVRGTIIGDITFPYEFWTLPDDEGNQHLVAKSSFANDAEAVRWVQRCYPLEYSHRLEMRVFGQDHPDA